MHESYQLGQVLASLVNTNDDVRGRLALCALVHIIPSYWCSNIDLKQLLLWFRSPHEGTSIAALACFSSLLTYLIETNVSSAFKKTVPIMGTVLNYQFYFFYRKMYQNQIHVKKAASY